MFKAKPDRCMYTRCWREATHKHQNLKCFGFCDDHWPGFVALMRRGTRPANIGPVDHEARDEALRLLADGMSPVMVARRVGVTVGTVYRWRVDAGKSPVKRGAVTEDEITEAVRMRLEGASWQQIGRTFGRSPRTFREALKHVADMSPVSKYSEFFRSLTPGGEPVEWPFEYSNPTTVAANINTGRYKDAPRGAVKARTIDGVIYVQAVAA